MLSLVALPLVVATVREGLQAIPDHVREASYAVGKTKIATIRRVLLPAARPSVITGHDARHRPRDRRHGDHRAPARRDADVPGRGPCPLLGTLRGTGSTLTSYVYDNSPTGEGNQPNKAYAAAFVLLMIVLALNVGVDVVRPPREGAAMELRKPPPVRRLTGWRALTAAAAIARPPPGSAPAARRTERQRRTDPASAFAAPAAPRAPAAARVAIDRMQVEERLDRLRREARPSSRSRCRSARARCWR